MVSTNFYALFVAVLAASAVSADHDNHWSRHGRAHRAVARSQPEAVVARSQPEIVERVNAPARRKINRRTCKAPSNSTSSAVASGTAVSASESATQTKATTSAKGSTSKTTSSAKSTATSSGSSSGGAGALALDSLFPMGQGSSSWTTSPKASDALPLSDDTLNPTKMMSELSHTYTNAPDGKAAMRAQFPKGAWGLGHDPLGGISFYAAGPSDFDITSAKELTLGYSVWFTEGFEYNMGGKLPGLYGGDSEDLAVSCSGGRRSVQCYSARFMFRTDGAGELYTYLPDYQVGGFEANNRVCDIAPFSTCNPTYGASVGRGSYSFDSGAWTTISQRVRLNDVGQSNGELQVWANGKSVINVGGLILRDSSDGAHRGIQMQTFFGGSDSSWASPQDQDIYFADFSMAITEKL
ncbi:Mitochondrial external NADH dehydrogenase [Mycena chlorophos]|uniref:Mitochondrial external NADH dehydrogenase n=1 Tax=Mycena chlorophos TaxID=658473 RepID=A0A8H6WGC0_MYCCL|nr:Mitochondrial external NADH dehydrogenase [Mycena chlorophos]